MRAGKFTEELKGQDPGCSTRMNNGVASECGMTSAKGQRTVTSVCLEVILPLTWP